jgi:hypothetical protein
MRDTRPTRAEWAEWAECPFFVPCEGCKLANGLPQVGL